MTGPASQSLDRDNPWPGLAPFDEGDRAFFHGRQAETADLLRLVRREPLTVLFGRSGLGKSSLLKAGLFPALRAEDLLPVYLRLDHAAAAPPLVDQLLQELQAACRLGRVQASVPAPQEGLWSCFHRRDAEFWSALNRPVTPVIVFDQFEEIFTLGQDGDAARARSAAFLSELADLVEGRPPAVVKLALEHDPAAAGAYEFRRASVKLVLSFREDFLAEMEGLKRNMPSVMVNRLRLLPMDGTQAYAVVTESGGALVSDEVARRILRLVWKNEPAPAVEPEAFPRIEIDPALLSVVCSELNHKRLAATPPLAQITLALLAGADREILAGFYERGVAGLDSRVRAFVEDELITDRGFRDSHDWDDALALAGVSREALEALIARRLLRVDERLGQRRLELTHDVLTRVVMDSRDRRRAREAEVAALGRERVALAQQRKNRQRGAILGAGILLLLLLVGVAAWQSIDAHKLLAEARSSRLMASADQLQDSKYDVSLLINLEALYVAPTRDAESSLIRRFNSHPNLAIFLRLPESKNSNSSDGINGLQFSLDGKQLVMAEVGGKVTQWNLDTLERRVLMDLGLHESVAAFSPDRKRLASAGTDGIVTLWDMASGKAVVKLDKNRYGLRQIGFSPDGTQLASIAGGDILVWDLESGKPPTILRGHRTQVANFAFGANGKWLASADGDGSVLLWDMTKREASPTKVIEWSVAALNKMAYPPNAAESITFSPDGKWLCYTMFSEVFFWDLAGGKAQARGKPIPGVSGIAFSPDGKWRVVPGGAFTLLPTDVPAPPIPSELLGNLATRAFSPDGKWFASASSGSTVILWDLGKRKLLTTWEVNSGSGADRDFVFSNDGQQMAAKVGTSVLLWDMVNRKLLAEFKQNETAVSNSAFSRDGKLLASIDEFGKLILWDLQTHEPLGTLDVGKSSGSFSIAFSPDGTILASAGKEGNVELWDPFRRKHVATLEARSEGSHAVVFSFDGKQLVSRSKSGGVMVWDIKSRKLLASNEGEGYGYGFGGLPVAFSANGKQIAATGQNNTVLLWDAKNLKQLATFEGHREPVISLAFSRNDKWLASAGAGAGAGQAILWDVDSRKALVSFEGATSVAFTSDGKQLVSNGKDGTVLLWDLDPEHLKAEACRTANRNLSCQEWRQYIGPDVPYRMTCGALPGPAEACR